MNNHKTAKHMKGAKNPPKNFAISALCGESEFCAMENMAWT